MAVFSLIEMLVVIAIIGIEGGVTVLVRGVTEIGPTGGGHGGNLWFFQ